MAETDTWQPPSAARTAKRKLAKRLKLPERDIALERVIEARKRGDFLPKSSSAPIMDGLPLWAAKMLIEARKRAKKRGHRCSLTRETMNWLVDRADGHCELTGIAFDFSKNGHSRRHFAPSLDRIDSERGYTHGNCRLVVYAANAAMNEWGFETLLILARAMVAKHG